MVRKRKENAKLFFFVVWFLRDLKLCVSKLIHCMSITWVEPYYFGSCRFNNVISIIFHLSYPVLGCRWIWGKQKKECKHSNLKIFNWTLFENWKAKKVDVVDGTPMPWINDLGQSMIMEYDSQKKQLVNIALGKKRYLLASVRKAMWNVFDLKGTKQKMAWILGVNIVWTVAKVEKCGNLGLNRVIALRRKKKERGGSHFLILLILHLEKGAERLLLYLLKCLYFQVVENW